MLISKSISPRYLNPSIFYVGVYHPLVFVASFLNIEAKVARISAVINIILIYKRFILVSDLQLLFFQFLLRDYIYGYILTRLKFSINIGLVEYEENPLEHVWYFLG